MRRAALLREVEESSRFPMLRVPRLGASRRQTLQPNVDPGSCRPSFGPNPEFSWNIPPSSAFARALNFLSALLKVVPHHGGALVVLLVGLHPTPLEGGSPHRPPNRRHCWEARGNQNLPPLSRIFERGALFPVFCRGRPVSTLCLDLSIGIPRWLKRQEYTPCAMSSTVFNKCCIRIG